MALTVSWMKGLRRGERSTEPVYGYRFAPPRLTFSAIGWGLLYIGLPVLALGFALDGIIWFVAREMFGVCYGLWCL